MIRNADIYAVAIRRPDGHIFAKRYPWRSISDSAWLGWPFIRGFPILLETLINGIHALNLSANIAEQSAAGPIKRWQLALSVSIAVLMAVAIFVLAPHLLSMLMLALHLGADVEGLSFHLWDGFFKCAIFVLYILWISVVPDIHRLFEYHGAEHKTIHAWEEGLGADYLAAHQMSRLHPRCGTTFLLFVICISILVQALIVPLAVLLWSPQSMLAKHIFSIFIKLLLIIPISGITYEIIRFAARLPNGFLADILQAPGLALQKLTTREPDAKQLEVAAAALTCALGLFQSKD